MRRVAGVIVLALLGAGCGSPAATPVASVAAPTTAPSATAAPTTTPTASAPSTAARTIAPAVAASGVSLAVDGAGHAVAIAGIPSGWMSMGSADVASEGAIQAWAKAHPDVTADSANSLAGTLKSSGAALLSFDVAGNTDGFTPNLNVMWVDAPAGDLEAWLAEQAIQVEKSYGLDAPYSYQALKSTVPGGLDGFAGAYSWTMQEKRLAGVQMAVPVGGRLALLTFTCLATQEESYGAIVQEIFTTLRKG